MNKFLTRLLVIALTCTGLTFVGSGTAQAACPGGSIKVEGTKSIHVTYSYGDIYATDRFLYPGQTSRTYGCDLDGFYVPAGEDILCFVGAWYRFAPTGWAKVNDTFRTDVPCHRTSQV